MKRINGRNPFRRRVYWLSILADHKWQSMQNSHYLYIPIQLEGMTLRGGWKALRSVAIAQLQSIGVLTVQSVYCALYSPDGKHDLWQGFVIGEHAGASLNQVPYGMPLHPAA